MSSSLSSLQLLLTAPGHPRQVVSIASDASVFDLHQLASQKFGQEIEAIKAGFPPKTLEKDSNEPLGSLLSPQERLQVVLKQTQTQTKSGKNKKKTKTASPTTNTPSSTNTRRPPRRATAQAATDGFKDVIKAQDRLMKEQKATSKKRPRPINNSSSSPKKKPSPRKPNISGPGRRLADGAAVKAGGRQQTTKQPWKSTDDVTDALLGSLQSGGGRVGHVLRGVMRNAVSNAYEENQAASKVAAVQSQQYQVDFKQGEYHISYNKGVQGRGMYEEVVQVIPKEALCAVVSGIYNSGEQERDLLRPTTLARISPRVFWNVVLCESGESSDANHTRPTSVETALARLLPNLDWCFLSRRPAKLSEKALENLRQQQQDEEETPQNEEAAQEAVQAVEDAMEHLQEYDRRAQRERALQAATQRSNTNSDSHTTQAHAPWQLVTPTEPDEEELRACLEDDFETYGALLQESYKNWRQLANANSDEVASLVQLSTDRVEDWLTRAQLESLEEIMVSLCDDLPQAVEWLRDEARTGTPKDLALWRHMPDVLWESAPSLQQEGVTVEQVQQWCTRAQSVVETWEWTTWYATPVE